MADDSKKAPFGITKNSVEGIATPLDTEAADRNAAWWDKYTSNFVPKGSITSRSPKE